MYVAVKGGEKAISAAVTARRWEPGRALSTPVDSSHMRRGA